MNGYNNFKIRTQLDGTNSRESKINDAKPYTFIGVQK